MYILENYDFLEPLVENGKVTDSLPFDKNGLCIVDNPTKPKVAYVFHLQKDCIWFSYAWTQHKNKAFYAFHQQVINIMLRFDLPILGTYINDVFKNHTKFHSKYKTSNIYEYIRP